MRQLMSMRNPMVVGLAVGLALSGLAAQPALPRVFHSVWRAPDGCVAAVLVNWSREAADYRIETPDVAAKGTLPARTWKLISKVGELESAPSR